MKCDARRFHEVFCVIFSDDSGLNLFDGVHTCASLDNFGATVG